MPSRSRRQAARAPSVLRHEPRRLPQARPALAGVPLGTSPRLSQGRSSRGLFTTAVAIEHGPERVSGCCCAARATRLPGPPAILRSGIRAFGLLGHMPTHARDHHGQPFGRQCVHRLRGGLSGYAVRLGQGLLGWEPAPGGYWPDSIAFRRIAASCRYRGIGDIGSIFSVIATSSPALGAPTALTCRGPSPKSYTYAVSCKGARASAISSSVNGPNSSW